MALASAAALAICTAVPTRSAAQPTQPQAGGTAGESGAGQAGQPQAGGAAKPLAANLRQDLEKLHASNQAEIETGKMAEQQAQSETVKQLGSTMDQQHSQMDQNLLSFAQQKGVNLEGPAYQKELKKLQINAKAKLTGKQWDAFDRAYTHLMVTEHTEDVNRTLPKAISDAQNSGETEVASMLKDVQSNLEQHLQLAQQAQASTKQAELGRAPGRSGPRRERIGRRERIRRGLEPESLSQPSCGERLAPRRPSRG